jgi:hypothetical protein
MPVLLQVIEKRLYCCWGQIVERQAHDLYADPSAGELQQQRQRFAAAMLCRPGALSW